LVRGTPFRALFLDYDFNRFDWVKEELTFLIHLFKLGDVIILQSSDNSFHAVCVDCFTAKEEQEIIEVSSCDDAFKNCHAFDFKSRVLRVSFKGNTEKPKFVCLLKSPYNLLRVKSAGHYLFFKANYDIKLWEIDKNLFLQSVLESMGFGTQIFYNVSLINYPTKKNVE